MFKFWGKVKRGQGRGKKLGFPTANINLHKKIPEGVYLSLTKINEKQIPSLTFIGSAKTFNETKYQAESYLQNFAGNLYGKYININLFKKIRGNLKFKNVESLVHQMAIDKKVLERHISTHE